MSELFGNCLICGAPLHGITNVHVCSVRPVMTSALGVPEKYECQECKTRIQIEIELRDKIGTLESDNASLREAIAKHEQNMKLHDSIRGADLELYAALKEGKHE